MTYETVATIVVLLTTIILGIVVISMLYLISITYNGLKKFKKRVYTIRRRLRNR